MLESEEAAPSFFDALQGPSAGRIHEIFEGDFCECLKQTGLKSYEDVTKCDIEYMYGLGIQEA